MNTFDPEQQRQDHSLKRRWHAEIKRSLSSSNIRPNFNVTHANTPTFISNSKPFPALYDDDDDLVSTVVPPVTVVLEGRSICQRISLHKHASYQSLAMALRQMFVDGGDAGGVTDSDTDLDLTNAVPGHLIAYEDMENDLLLAGDLNWKDFVRVAKRIRILPVKGNSRKGRGGA
ncbi:auxin-responsive protein IAA33 [Ricinus communis]|uniref:Auxin-responsive protein n=1 Tax=Ricinus communis TaxID=3988 RepID=B9T1W9_RICCO|nr:auxin-responsive protein IAA33 [Ricinus communis]EEF30147.1 transcription factor, putative [Ricinus communis]|eukprot:XP_002532238.1 auxin-responsive protein IAA33 [Ricinus communis]